MGQCPLGCLALRARPVVRSCRRLTLLGAVFVAEALIAHIGQSLGGQQILVISGDAALGAADAKLAATSAPMGLRRPRKATMMAVKP